MQSRASQTLGRMFTSDTRTGADASSNMASNVSAVSGGTQGSDFSETGRKSHSEQMTDKSKDTDFEGRLGQIQGASSRILPVGVCILALVVMAVLIPFVFSTSGYTARVKVLEEKRTEDKERETCATTNSTSLYSTFDDDKSTTLARSPERLYADTTQTTEVMESSTLSDIPPKPTRPAAGHLGSSCRKSSSCLGEALCIDGVCRCEGPDVRIVEGACVPAVTAEMEEPPLSEKATTNSQRSSTRTRPQFTVTLRPGAPTMGQGSESKPTSLHEGSGVNATVVVGTVLEGESSRGTESWSSTADWPSSTKVLPPIAGTIGLYTTSTSNVNETKTESFEERLNSTVDNGTVLEEEGSPGTESRYFTGERHSITETLQPFADTVGLDKTSTLNASEIEPTTFVEESGLKRTEYNGSVPEKEGSTGTEGSPGTESSPGTENWNSTADWHSNAETLQHFTGDLRLEPSTTRNISETEAATFKEDSGSSKTTHNTTVLEEENSRREMEDRNSTDDGTSSIESLQPVVGITRLGTISTWKTTETEPAIFEADSGGNTTLVNETVVKDEDSPGTKGPDSTEDLSVPDVL